MDNMYDVHCHALPGVDDGASSVQEAIDILRMEYKDGVRSVILTPHFRRGMFETPRERIKGQFDVLKKAAKETLPDMQLHLGCEFHADKGIIDFLQKDESYCMAGTKFVLVEFSGGDSTEYMFSILSQLFENRYKPIIAHVERCEVFWDSISALERMVLMGVHLQINAESLVGQLGRHEKKLCHRLIERDFLSYIGSDAHDTTVRRPLMGESSEYVAEKWGRDYAEKIFVHNPAKILV